MTPEYKAGMMKAADMCSAKQQVVIAAYKLCKDDADRLHAIGIAQGIGQMAIDILTAIESGAGEDKP